MPKKVTEKKKLPNGWLPSKFYLNGEPVDRIPQEAMDKMSERLSRVVSQHFREHPEEYEPFLEGLKELRAQKALT